jgi:hypothetical protein
VFCEVRGRCAEAFEPKGIAMRAVVGPVVTRNGGYAFDLWTLDGGLSQSFCYGRVEDAHYARRFEMKSFVNNIDCASADQFKLLVDHSASADF